MSAIVSSQKTLKSGLASRRNWRQGCTVLPPGYRRAFPCQSGKLRSEFVGGVLQRIFNGILVVLSLLSVVVVVWQFLVITG